MSKPTQLLAAAELDTSLDWLRDLFNEKCESGSLADTLVLSKIFEARAAQPIRRAIAELERSC